MPGPDAGSRSGSRRGAWVTLALPVVAPRTVFPLTLALTLLCGCGAPVPDGVPPPFQRRLPPGPEPRPVGAIVTMSEQDADAHIVRDVSPAAEGVAWRWTFQRPELRFWLEETTRQRLIVDFAIAEDTFKSTGPVTVTFFVNGKTLGRQRCPKAGLYHFEKPVPAAWLRADDFTLVAAQADKLWTSPADGARLGFILSRAGFLR